MVSKYQAPIGEIDLSTMNLFFLVDRKQEKAQLKRLILRVLAKLLKNLNQQ